MDGQPAHQGPEGHHEGNSLLSRLSFRRDDAVVLEELHASDPHHKELSRPEGPLEEHEQHGFVSWVVRGLQELGDLIGRKQLVCARSGVPLDLSLRYAERYPRHFFRVGGVLGRVPVPEILEELLHRELVGVLGPGAVVRPVQFRDERLYLLPPCPLDIDRVEYLREAHAVPDDPDRGEAGGLQVLQKLDGRLSVAHRLEASYSHLELVPAVVDVFSDASSAVVAHQNDCLFFLKTGRHRKLGESAGGGILAFPHFEPATSGFRIRAWDYEFRPPKACPAQ